MYRDKLIKEIKKESWLYKPLSKWGNSSESILIEDAIKAFDKLSTEVESSDSVYLSIATDIYNYIWHNHRKPADGKSQRLHIAGMIKSICNKS